MGVEIERRFLINGNPWWSIPGVTHRDIRQGYLSISPESTVRIRLERYVEDRVEISHGYVTIKGRSVGAVRKEYEYRIDPNDAAEMISSMCGHVLEKRRWYIPQGKRTWHVDVFGGQNQGLAIAEIELDSEDEALELPGWVSTEITDDYRYANSNLAANPWKSWRTVDNR